MCLSSVPVSVPCRTDGIHSSAGDLVESPLLQVAEFLEKVRDEGTDPEIVQGRWLMGWLLVVCYNICWCIGGGWLAN